MQGKNCNDTSKFQIPPRLSEGQVEFLEMLYVQVGIKKLYLRLVLNDLKNEFFSEDSRVLEDWKINTRNLEYLAVPACEFINAKLREVSNESENRKGWDYILNKNMARLVCFQNEVKDANKLFSSTEMDIPFDNLEKPLEDKIALAYVMCFVWQGRIADDLQWDLPQRDVDNRILESRKTKAIFSTSSSWNYDQPENFGVLFDLNKLILDFGEKITRMDFSKQPANNGEEVEKSVSFLLDLCMASRRLFMALFFAIVTNRNKFFSNSVTEFFCLYEKAYSIACKHPNPEAKLVASGIAALKRRLELVGWLFDIDSQDPFSALEKIAASRDLSYLGDDQQKLLGSSLLL